MGLCGNICQPWVDEMRGSWRGQSVDLWTLRSTWCYWACRLTCWRRWWADWLSRCQECKQKLSVWIINVELFNCWCNLWAIRCWTQCLPINQWNGPLINTAHSICGKRVSPTFDCNMCMLGGKKCPLSPKAMLKLATPFSTSSKKTLVLLGYSYISPDFSHWCTSQTSMRMETKTYRPDFPRFPE